MQPLSGAWPHRTSSAKFSVKFIGKLTRLKHFENFNVVLCFMFFVGRIKIVGNLSADRFLKLSEKYENEHLN